MKLTYDEWMKKVDAILFRRYGITSADLIDCCYADWYADGKTPAGAVSAAIKAEREG
jgi:hypothetical protein